MRNYNNLLKSAFLLGILLLMPGKVYGSVSGNALTGISHRENGASTEVILQFRKSASFSIFRNENPPGITVELSHTRNTSVKNLKIESWAVSHVGVTTAVSGKVPYTRVSIVKARSGTYTVNSAGNRVIIVFTATQLPPPSTRAAMEKLAFLQKKSLEMEKQLSIARENLNRAKRELKREKNSLSSVRSDNSVLLSHIEKARKDYRLLSKKNSDVRTDLLNAEKQMKIARIKEKAALRRLADIERKTRQLNNARVEKAAELKKLSRTIWKRKIGARKLEKKLSEYQKEISRLNLRISSGEKNGQSVTDLKTRVVLLKTRTFKAEKDLKSVRKTVEKEESRRENLKKLSGIEEKKLAALKLKLGNERTILNSEISKLEQGVDNLRNKRSSLLGELKALENNRKFVQKSLRKEKILARKYREARENSQKLHQKARKLADIEISKAKKAELERKNHEILIADQKNYLSKLNVLKKNEENNLRALKKSREAHERLLKSEKARLRNLALSGNRKKLEALRQKQSRRLAEIKKLEKSAYRVKRNIDNATSSLRTMEKKISRSMKKLNRTRNEYRDIQVQLASMSKLRDEARAGLFQMKASLESTTLKRKSVQRKLNVLERNLAGKRREVKKVSIRLSSMEKKISSLSREKYLREAEMKSLASTASLLEKRIQENNAKISGLNLRKTRLKSEIDSLESRYRKIKSSMEKGRKANVSEENRLAKLMKLRKQKIAELEAKKAALLKDIAAVSSAKSEKHTRKISADKSVVATITAVDFVNSPWSHQVVLSFKGKEIPDRTYRKGNTILVRLPGAVFNKELARNMDTSAYKGPVSRFLTWNNSKSGKEALVKIYTNGIRRSEIRRRAHKLVILIPKSVAEVRSHKNRMKNVAPTVVAGYYSNLGKVVNNNLPTATKRKYRRSIKRAGKSRRGYRGRFVDLDFKDADLHNVIRLVTEVWGRSVVIPDDVKGTVTIKLTNVRVDRAFDVILKSKGLDWSYEGGNIIRIMTYDQMKKEREEMIARTQTKVKLIQTETRLIPINYASAQDIAKTIESNVKSSRGKVTFDKRTNVIIFVDVPSKLKVAEKLVRSLDLPTPQVQIEARIVEAESTFLREIGVQWGGSLLASSATGNPTGLIFPSNIGIAGGNMDTKTVSEGISSAGATNPDFAVNLPASTGSGSGGALGMTLGSLAGAMNINLRLSAMEEIGHVRSIAAPKITTLDNTEAKITQGVEIPYPQSSAQGNTVIMKQAVLSLSVTPHVTNDNMVQLKIEVTKDEPDETNKGADGSLGIAKKAAKTNMLIKSGDTAVIGGIYKRQSTLLYRKIPWFADLPIFGWLFKSQYKKDTRSELLIFITPRVLNRSGVIGSK
ncbi:MAG: type IV pilus secretin PilQ [Deltaproteobacteria bacterium]|nr:type IV pilus secretin PilQ [Deltaproteobacteria bacterium]